MVIYLVLRMVELKVLKLAVALAVRMVYGKDALRVESMAVALDMKRVELKDKQMVALLAH